MQGLHNDMNLEAKEMVVAFLVLTVLNIKLASETCNAIRGWIEVSLA